MSLAPPATRQTNSRSPVWTHDAGIQIAIAVNLCATDEAYIEKATLGKEEGVGDPGKHLGAVGPSHLVGGDRKAARKNLRADGSPLDDNGKTRGMGLLCQDCREQWYSHTRKHRGHTEQLACGRHSKKFRGRIAHDLPTSSRA